jgi:hypothetical protein
MSTRKIIDGLLLLEPYYDKSDKYTTQAEHDVLYAYATAEPLSTEDLIKMAELGWCQENTNAGVVTPDNYQPDEAWFFYV